MGQRSKVLDTEGQTPKFLYAVLKQLDMKSVNWNRVASDLEISNGHAARMRYSRFRSQMEPSSARKNPRKKNVKKGEKGNCKSGLTASVAVPMSMQMPFPMTASGPAPKIEPFEPQFSHRTFVKCETRDSNDVGDPGFAEIPDFQRRFQHMMPPNSMPYFSHMPQYMPHGMQYSIPVSMSPLPPSLNLSNHENTYPSMALSNDDNMHTFSLQQPAFHNSPVITWEPPAAAAQRGSTPVKIEDEPEIVYNLDSQDAPIEIEELCKEQAEIMSH